MQPEKQLTKKQLAKQLVALYGPKFHGSITIHVADGEPKKVKTEQTEDLH